MFNLGLFELGLFGIIALIVLGPKKLITAARTLGRWYGDFRRMSARLQSELVSELELTEVQNALKAEIDEIRASEARMRVQMQELHAKLHRAETTYPYKAKISSEQDEPDCNTHDTPKIVTVPLTYRFFLLGDYDKKRRLPPPPFMPNYKADKLLYQEGV